MICPNCKNETADGKFCEKCGSPVADTSENLVGATLERPMSQADPGEGFSPYVEKTKEVSRQYFQYFIGVLKQPYSVSKSIGNQQLVNGLITMGIFSIMIPLMLYIGIRNISNEMSDFGSILMGEVEVYNPPFFDVVVIPTIYYFIFTMLLVGFTFIALKLGKLQVDFKEVIARFGSLLVPCTALLAVALIMTILKMKWFVFVLSLALCIAMFMVPVLVLTGYKQKKEGLDILYSAGAIYILTFIAIYIFADYVVGRIASSFSSFF